MDGATQSILPRFRRQRQFVEFGPRLAPGRIALIKGSDKAIVARGFDQVRHLMHDDVFE